MTLATFLAGPYPPVLHIDINYELVYSPQMTLLIEEQPIYADYVTKMFVLSVTIDSGELLKQIVIQKDNETTYYHMNYTLTELFNKSIQCLSIIVSATTISPYYGESTPAVTSEIIFAGNIHSQN